MIRVDIYLLFFRLFYLFFFTLFRSLWTALESRKTGSVLVKLNDLGPIDIETLYINI